ncbi:VOC family protein [Maribacter ulvicola]|uniref:Catechol 2,3-dioxygenase n=1 Tax=Maribacter ulvicola TaxID=228959 RepID=A0A1N7AVS1_9FLAO|nr:VOC family protein [Maribacter ulvicola]SIR43136.1 Catechol 2,3-dioxygenase [Maribacter ulvicola]
MKIKLVSVPVESQDRALKFYTSKLNFVKKKDIPVGEANRWLTLVSGEEQDGPELLLEPAPMNFEPSMTYQKALFEAGIPYTQFDVADVQKEYERLINLGVKFSIKPTKMGAAKLAVFNDTCGNHIQIIEVL